MKTQEVIDRVKELGIASDGELTAAMLRKLVHDGVVTPAPRSIKSVRKGRPPSDWSEETVAEIAAYLVVKKIDERDVRTNLPKRSIKEVRIVSQNVRNEPWSFCAVNVDNDGNIDLDPQHRWFRFKLRQIGKLVEKIDFFSKYVPQKKTEFDIEIERDALFKDLQGVEEFFKDLQNRKKEEPTLFNKDEGYAIDELSESVGGFRRQFGNTHKLPDFEFTVPVEVSKWLATYEKVLNERPLFVPLRIDYRWMVDVKFTKKATENVSRSEQDQDLQRADIAYTLDVVARNSSYRGSPVQFDSVNVQYLVRTHYTDEDAAELS